MDLIFFIKGLVAGFVVTAPVGPMGVLCVERTLSHGRRAGFISGLGAATADGFYSAVAAYGLALVSDFLREKQLWVGLFGVSFLMFIGIRILLSRVSDEKAFRGKFDLAGDYASGFIITIANPATAVAFAVIFAALGMGSARGDITPATMMVSGVVVGAALCWLVLSLLVNAFRSRFREGITRVFRVFFGIVIIISGMALFLAVIFGRNM
jgi:threonine/homoserine/homoserine lactone efflux protein